MEPVIRLIHDGNIYGKLEIGDKCFHLYGHSIQGDEWIIVAPCEGFTHALEVLGGYKLEDVPDPITSLEMNVAFDSPRTIGKLIIVKSIENYLRFRLVFRLDWTEPFTFSSYAHEFKEIIKGSYPSDLSIHETRESPPGFEIVAACSPELTIRENLDRAILLLAPIEKEARRRLVAAVRSDSLVLLFDLPESVKISCEQYLLYFIQFLSDVGVEADAELTNDAGQVLFSVKPKNKEDGLDKLREALDLYLKLPAGRIDENIDEENTVAVQRLTANVHHFRGQLALAQALIKMKDKTIETMEATIALKQHQLDGFILLDSAKDVSPGGTDNRSEQLLSGRVEVGKLEKYGISVNLGQLIRDLRKLFGRSDD